MFLVLFCFVFPLNSLAFSMIQWLLDNLEMKRSLYYFKFILFLRSHHFLAKSWGNNRNSERLYFLASKIPLDGDCSYEIKRHLLLGRKAMANLDRGITLPTNVYLVKTVIFPVVMYGYESSTIQTAEHQRIYAFELCCQGRLLGVPLTGRRSNQSNPKEISPEYSLEGLMLRLIFQYYGFLMQRSDSSEKILLLGKIEGERRRRRQRRRCWMASPTQRT